MTEKNKSKEPIVVTYKELGLDKEIKPRVKVELTLEEKYKVEVERLTKLNQQLTEEMEDRNEILRAKLYYEEHYEMMKNHVVNMLEVYDETGYIDDNLSSYSSLLLNQARKAVENKEEQ